MLTDIPEHLLQSGHRALQMQNSSAIPASHDGRISFPRQIRNFLLQKLWLPRIIYEALPYLYLFLGIIALVSAVHIPGWAWMLPYAILFSLICLHVSLAVIALRYNYRCDKEPWRNCRLDDEK